MDKEENLERVQAVSSFIETKPERYLAMVHNIEKRLKLCLGEDRVSTALAEEVMNEVLSDVMDGTREWDRSKYDAEQVLWYNIPSEVSALVKKEMRYVLVNAPPPEYEEEENGNGIENIAVTSAGDLEGEMDARILEDHCCNVILKDDIDEQIIFNEMLTGKKQKQIAEYLGITIEESETKIRSIRRKISKQIPYHMLENIAVKLKDKILNQT